MSPSPVAVIVESLEAAGVRFRLDGKKVKAKLPKPAPPEVLQKLETLRVCRGEVATLLRLRQSEAFEPTPSTEDIDLALKIGTHLETLPVHRSATASEIAEVLHGQDYTLAQVVDIYRICQELREARILIRGREGYGYQFSAW